MTELFDEFEDWYKSYSNVFNTRDININDLVLTKQYNKTRVPEEHYICAEIANEVYEDPRHRKMSFGDYRLDTGFNFKRTVLYKNEYADTPNYIIGIRGTKATVEDYLTDVLLLFGKSNVSIRKKTQLSTVREIMEVLKDDGYDNSKSFITGHSLGGMLTAHILEYVPYITGIGFNTGSSPAQLEPFSLILGNRPSLRTITNSGRFINYIVKGDLIALASKYLFSDTVVIIPKPPAKNAIEAHRMTFLLKNIEPRK